MARTLALIVLVAGLALAVVRLPVVSAPAPPQSSCVACHTNKAALGPLVKPFPVIPAEGEG